MNDNDILAADKEVPSGEYKFGDNGMTRDDIIRMARKAGAIFDNDDCLDDCAIEIWARFAFFVAEAERKECIRIFKSKIKGSAMVIATAIRARGEQK